MWMKSGTNGLKDRYALRDAEWKLSFNDLKEGIINENSYRSI